MGMTDLVLYTCSGGMRMVYLNYFAQMIPIEVVNHPTVSIIEPSPMISGVSEFAPPMAQIHTKRILQLQPIGTITDRALQARDRIMDIRREMVDVHIQSEIKTMIAKHEHAFFIKDLSIESLDKLSEEYCKKLGGDSVGVHIKLSEYQKLFLITNPENYKMFVEQNGVREPMTLETRFYGKLACFNEGQNVVGRYENLTYLNELNAQRVVRT